MNNNTNTNLEITNLDYNAMRRGYDALINSVILASIDDLGYDALNDDGTLDWIALTDLNTDVLRNAIATMPLKKDGSPDARPAMRRIMESLDARESTDEMVDVVVQFDSPELDTISEPSDSELAQIEASLDNLEWNSDGV
jgi:hypothetical protein